ncbi:glutathione S-transferase family protein [Oryzibacter oryziterrae]|uniref:glutathione S-transferase family protein n=1 Tax=Oryzibacter oryziterrae TaxID=2766474 RepID=UPI001F28F4D2|nr:glutathione S-transferase C-terminal domain-containing protein [Oryzibacter oryziterrae]
MITLCGFGPFGELPDTSPFVVKTHAQLRLAGLAYETATGLAVMRKSPTGKMPYIVDDGVTVSDSDLIGRHITKRHGFDFYAGYDARDRAIAHAVEEMLEERFYFLIVHARWIDEAGWPVMRAYLKSVIPAPVNLFVPDLGRRKVRKLLHAQGVGRHDDATRLMMAESDLDALVTLLGDKPFLLGDRPSGVDASIFGMVGAALSPAFPTALQRATAARPTLVAYMQRMRERLGF